MQEGGVVPRDKTGLNGSPEKSRVNGVPNDRAGSEDGGSRRDLVGNRICPLFSEDYFCPKPR